MKKYAVIVAAGAGTRMGTNMPKQFLLLLGKPVLAHTLSAFTTAFPGIRIVLVAPPAQLELSAEIVRAAGVEAVLVAGAASRFGSVKAGLAEVPDEALVFVHDGVRCLPTPSLLQRCFEEALQHGNAIPAVAATDSVRLARGGSNEWIDRSAVRLVQTPQTFQASLLKEAYRLAQTDHYTDDAAVAEQAGIPIHLIEGEAENIKITRPIDLVIAEQILRARQ